ncbi:MAG: serine/threonine protein kinase, partial [Trichodesmium sp. MAG_R04]|nr:serine/threonine protein kinase [Trichodesmium sp. MAG_R04]
MSYCLNPQCQNPQNPQGTLYCIACGSKLLLRERYRPIKPIGRGGFGRTFFAVDEDKPSHPPCVIKQFSPQSTGDPKKAAELFQQEAVRLDELGKHPQIPELLAHFEQDNYQYLVQEFID